MLQPADDRLRVGRGVDEDALATGTVGRDQPAVGLRQPEREAFDQHGHSTRGRRPARARWDAAGRGGCRPRHRRGGSGWRAPGDLAVRVEAERPVATTTAAGGSGPVISRSGGRRRHPSKSRSGANHMWRKGDAPVGVPVDGGVGPQHGDPLVGFGDRGHGVRHLVGRDVAAVGRGQLGHPVGRAGGVGRERVGERHEQRGRAQRPRCRRPPRRQRRGPARARRAARAGRPPASSSGDGRRRRRRRPTIDASSHTSGRVSGAGVAAAAKPSEGERHEHAEVAAERPERLEELAPGACRRARG